MQTRNTLGLQVLILVEDDDALARRLQKDLEDTAFWVKLCCAASEAMEWLHAYANHPPDVLIINVPNERSVRSMNAFKLYEFIRKGGVVPTLMQRFPGWGYHVPIVMLVDAEHRLDIEERMYALSVHPDKIEYKPYRISVLIAKLKSLVYRGEPTLAPADDQVLRIGPLVIDPKTESALSGAVRLHLSQLEYRLLYYFATHPNTPLRREQLLEDIWGISGAKAVNNRNVDVYISRLRKKLEAADCSGILGRARNNAYLFDIASVQRNSKLTNEGA